MEGECGICKERMKEGEARTLPCLHSYCRLCLHSLFASSGSEGKAKCPLCRFELELAPPLPPRNESSSSSSSPPTLESLQGPFPPLMLLRNILARDHDQLDPNNPRCQWCEEHEAVAFCSACQEFCCDACQKVHRKQKMSSFHQYLSVEDGFSAKKSFVSTHCQIHPKFEMSKICVDDRKPVCPECVIEFHYGHTIKSFDLGTSSSELNPLNEISLEIKQSIQASLKLVNPMQKALEKTSQELGRRLEEVEVNARKAEDATTKSIQQLVELLFAKQAELLGKVETIRHEKRKLLQNQKDEIDFFLESLRVSTLTAQYLHDHGTPLEIALDHNQVRSRLETLKNIKYPLEPCQDSAIDLNHQHKDSLMNSIKDLDILTSKLSLENSFIEGKDFSRPLQINEKVEFKVIWNDQNGKRYPFGGEQEPIIELQTPNNSLLKVGIQNPLDGSHLISFTPTILGNYRMGISLGSGNQIRGCPFNFTVVEKPVFRCDLFKVNQLSLRFGSEGRGDGQFSLPRGVTCNSKGEIIVADCQNHRIQIFSSTGQFLRKFGSYGHTNGQFNQPYCVCVDFNEQIIVADTLNDRVQIFDFQGNFIKSIGSKGIGEGELNEPRGVTVDPNGNYFVTDYNNHRVQIFDSNGKFLRKFGSRAQMNSPRGIGILSTGHIILGEFNGNRIQVFDSQGIFSKTIAKGLVSNPWHIFVDSDDNILVADYNNQRIQVMNSNGRILKTITTNGIGNPRGVTMDQQGRIIVSSELNTIGIF